MKYLLDTNACVDYLNGRFPRLTERIQRSAPSDLAISSVAVAELRYGAEKSAQAQRNHERLGVPWRRSLRRLRQRCRVGLRPRPRCLGTARCDHRPYDLQIAAHALSSDLVLVSDNVREFRRVEGLKVQTGGAGCERSRGPKPSANVLQYL